ncbi:MAG TPA: hypothetical protein VF149_07990, partial [Bacillales bacterium]
MKRSKLSFLVVLVLCLAMFLAACSSGAKQSTEANTDADSSGGQSSDQGDSSSNEGDTSGEQATGKPLVMVPSPKGSFEKNFNPFNTTSLDGTNGLIYEPLAYLDPVSGKTYHFLAKDIAWSNGNKTLTVTLKDNVKWSDSK